MQLTTFGFEFEVATEAPALTRYLFAAGLVGQQQMCRWHCPCDLCSLDSGFLFRAQTDSSCSGEIITSILHHDPANFHYNADVFTILENAAVETDAEPGLEAGMHVHVGVSHLTPAQLDKAFWAYLRYEHLLMRLAGGRWPNQRADANTMVRDCVSLHLRDLAGGPARTTVATIAAIEESGRRLANIRQDVTYTHRHNDRHSNLNLSTGHGTWEFRLWNSTRSAWRMELFTRLSVALVDPAVVDRLLKTPLKPRVTRQLADSLSCLLHDAGHERAAELTDRQATYSWGSAATAPSTLTAS